MNIFKLDSAFHFSEFFLSFGFRVVFGFQNSKNTVGCDNAHLEGIELIGYMPNRAEELLRELYEQEDISQIVHVITYDLSPTKPHNKGNSNWYAQIANREENGVVPYRFKPRLLVFLVDFFEIL